jgi:hypothetical protein
VGRTAADYQEFGFEQVRNTTDEMLLPGALKYGNLSALAALTAPAELFVHNNRASSADKWLSAAYQAAGAADKLNKSGDKAVPEAVVDWLLR